MEQDIKEQESLANFRLMSYRFLQGAFSYPDDKTYDIIMNSPLKSLKEEDGRFGFFDNIPPKEKMQVLYTSYFDVIYKKDGCHLREGEYMDEKSGISDLLLELKSFYKNFGLNLPQNELPDQVGIEFEFMYYLTHLYLKNLAESHKERRLSILNAQKDFLTRHLYSFLSGIKNRLSGVEKLKFYSKAGNFAFDFVGADIEIISHMLN
ncbi:MAG: molecular chaperone TorD family protein [bacterium]